MDVLVLARQALNRSSHGPFAASFGWKWTAEGPVAAAGRSARARAATRGMVRPRIADDLAAAPLSTAKTCLEVGVTLRTTKTGVAILRLGNSKAGWTAYRPAPGLVQT